MATWESFTSGLYLAGQDSVQYYADNSTTTPLTWSNNGHHSKLSHVSSMVTCNNHVSARAMVASDDGCVRVWSVDDGGAHMVTGWVVKW